MNNVITCDKCSKLYSSNSSYNRHIKLNRCKIKITTNEIKCNYCDKSFKSKQNKQKHELKCKDIRNNELKKLNDKITQLEKTVKLSQPSTTNNIVNNNNTNTNNTQVNYFINNYGNEDISHITKRDFLRIFKTRKMSIPKFIEMLHFNKDVPQNHNVYISNYKDNYALIFSNNKWKIIDKNEILRKLIFDSRDLLETEFDEFKVSELKNKMDERSMELFQEYLNNVEDDNIMNGLKETIKLLLYNEKDMVLEFKRKVINGITEKGILTINTPFSHSENMIV
jgi:hypothetical protein